MPIAFPTPDHMPCPDCGASVPVTREAVHVCEAERLLDYRLSELRPEIERFDGDLEEWLETPTGRFAIFLAERNRP